MGLSYVLLPNIYHADLEVRLSMARVISFANHACDKYQGVVRGIYFTGPGDPIGNR